MKIIKIQMIDHTLHKTVTGNQKGSALIITLLLISILTALVVDFVYDVHIDSSSVSNWSNAQKASLISKSGQNMSTLYITEIKLSDYSDQQVVEMPSDYNFGPGTFLTIKIEDENSKFNINSIIEPNGNTNKEKLASLNKLFDFLDINPDLALLIADWIDPDSEPRLTNSEDNAKNAFLWSADELRLIEGINDIFDTIQPYITVHESRVSLVHQVNINTAEIPVLVSLHPDMTETLAQNIIDERINFPFESTAQVQNVPGMENIGPLLLGKISVKSSNFRITTRATVNEITRIIESVIDTSMNVHFWRET